MASNSFRCLSRCCLSVVRGGFRIGVRAAERFRDDFVHQFESEQILRGDFQGFGGFGGGGPVLPQDRRAAFRADDGVVGVLQDEHAVGHADAERAARAAFADDRRR